MNNLNITTLRKCALAIAKRVLIALSLIAVPLVASAAETEKLPLFGEELPILLNFANLKMTAESVVQLLSERSPEADDLRNRLQAPVGSHLLIQANRLSDEIRAKLDTKTPEEVLHRYVVLKYADAGAASAAKSALEKSPDVVYVMSNEYAQFAAVPSDPYYAAAPATGDYQWGMNDRMLLQSAWGVVRGTAYLAVLDSGVQSLPLHDDLGQPFRRFNFNVTGNDADVDEHPEFTTPRAAGHGTHVAGIMAGATSQLGVASGYPNPASVGISGACWFCSLLVGKITTVDGGFVVIPSGNPVTAIYWAVNSGAQVINLSFGTRAPNPVCPANLNDAFCAALAFAAAKSVVVAAAAGNSDYFDDVLPGGPHVGNALGTKLQFPASDGSTIAVGATQAYIGPFAGREHLWTEETPRQYFHGTNSGLGMQTRGILAPGRVILSTFYTGQNWKFENRCGTETVFTGFGPGTSVDPVARRYGVCTGTSMATPHITGIVGLMRTINPLLDAQQIRSILLSTGYNAATPNDLRGSGISNAFGAVNGVLATTNRLTPLFSSYSSVAKNHFYTVVPQMARAAYAGALIPFVGTPSQYVPYGNPINVYSNFPDPASINYVAPRAQAWVFTTHANPANANVELMPLYRLSWKCGDGGVSTCASNPGHVRHFYTANLAEAQANLTSNFYKFDGIEGYVYPSAYAKPLGTSALLRAYNAIRDDFAVFPEQEQLNMASEGYTGSVTVLGYAYANGGSRPSY